MQGWSGGVAGKNASVNRRSVILDIQQPLMKKWEDRLRSNA